MTSRFSETLGKLKGKTSSSNSSFSSSNSSPSSLPSFRFSKDTEELLEIINEPPEPITAEDQKHTNQTNNEDPAATEHHTSSHPIDTPSSSSSHNKDDPKVTPTPSSSLSDNETTATNQASGFSLRNEASPIKEALLTKFAKLAPNSSNANSVLSSPAGNSSGGGGSSASSSLLTPSGPQALSSSLSAVPSSTSLGSSFTNTESSGTTQNSIPPILGTSAPDSTANTSSPSWLHAVKGRIAKTVEEKYSEYKSERDKKQANQKLLQSGQSLDIPDSDLVRNDASGKCGPVSSSLGGSADELTFIPHSFSEGGISTGSVVAAPDAEDGAFTSLPDLKGSQSQQGFAMVSHTSESTTGGLASLPCNINTSSSATLDSFVSNELGGDIQDSDLPDSRTPVPSLNLLSNASSSSALNSPPKERKRFTFSFLGDKNKDKDKEKGGPLLGSSPSGSSSSQKSDQQQVTKSDSNELVAASNSNLTPSHGINPTSSTAGPLNNTTPTRTSSLKSRMMGLMGKTSSAQNTPAASSAGGINASASLGALPMVEDPFGGGNVDRLSPETEENSFAGGNPGDDDDVEAALEADELLVFDPSLAANDPNADPDQLSFLDTGIHEGDGTAKDESDGGEQDESLLGQYWWLASLPICVILLLQFMPLPNWLTGFLTGMFLGVPSSVYVMWKFFVKEDDESRPKFIDNVRKRVPKRPAIIVQEELERKYTWMNMWPAKNGVYDPLTYDVRRTMSVKVMLHGPWIELKFPKRNLPLRRMNDDVEPTNIAFLEQKEVIDLTNCAIDLIPENLPSKRTWSKKYPIRIRTNVRKPIANEDSNRPSEDVLGKPGSDHDLDRGGGSPTVMIPDPVVTAKKVLEDVALGVVSSSAESGTINPDMELRWKKGRESPPLIPLESVMKDDSEGEGAEDFDDALDNTQNDSEKSKVMASNVSTLINSGSGDQTTEEVVAKTTDDSCGENKKDSLAVPAETAEGATESEESFEILAEDAESRTFFLFTRTSREKEEWFNRFIVGAKFMQDWNHQNPPRERQSKPDPSYETFKVKEQRFKIFMENYFQARHAEGAEKVHSMTKEDEEKQVIAKEQVAFLNAYLGRLWFDLHNSKAFIDLLREKITRKLLKVKIAQYFEEVSVTTLDLGQRLPQILSASLPWQDELGLWVNLDIEYNGVGQATVETQGIRLPSKDEPTDREAQEFVSRPAATMDSDEEDSAEEDDEVPENPPENSLDVLDPASSATLTPGDHLAVHGSGFKARVLEGLLKSDFVAKVAESEWVKKNITGKQITLQLQLHSIKGTLTVNMPPAPSDRIWYGFRTPPQMDLALRPCFGGKSLGKYEATFSTIMRQMEKRLKQEFMKVLVYPNLDDEVIPLLSHGPYSLGS